GQDHLPLGRGPGRGRRGVARRHGPRPGCGAGAGCQRQCRGAAGGCAPPGGCRVEGPDPRPVLGWPGRALLTDSAAMAAMTRARGWGVVVLVALGAAVAQAFGRFTYSVLLPAVRDDLGVSNTVAGLL